jgi:hypothetical protein
VPCTPNQTAERVVEFVLPPACREEVLGDLHERCGSPRQYVADALRTVPFVIASRIRRVTDPQVALLEVFVLYLSFLSALEVRAPVLLRLDWAYLRPAIPTAVAFLILRLVDAYAKPGRRAALAAIQDAVMAMALTILLGVLCMPLPALCAGAALGVLLVSGLRLLFPPIVNRPAGANGPAMWLHHQAAVGFKFSPAVLVAIAAVVFLFLRELLRSTYR